jgi:hydrogenase maturation factor
VDGKVLDWHWKKRQVDTLFYVGDIYIGQVFNAGKSGWTALHKTANSIGLAHGFQSRYAASHFLLKFETKIQY